MTEREAFIAAIAAAPDEHTPRLVFADWLEEHGEDERARFVRLVCEIAALRAELGHPSPPWPDALNGPVAEAEHLFEARGAEWLRPFHRALGCEPTGPAPERGWAGRLWDRVAGESLVCEHNVTSFQGDAAELELRGNAPAYRLDLRCGFAHYLKIDFGSPFAVPDFDAALRLEPVSWLSLRLAANPALWRSLDVANLSRVWHLGLDLPQEHSRRNAAALADILFGENWAGLDRLHVWCPRADGFVIPHGFVHQLANAPLLSRLSAINCNVAAADLPLLVTSPHARNLRAFPAMNSPYLPAAAEVLCGATFRPNLEALDLSMNDLGDAGARALAAVAWPKLRKLCLNFCRITDAGVSELLPLVPPLAELELMNYQITDAGARLLADAVDADALESLCLSHCTLSEAVVAELRERFGGRFHFTARDDPGELQQFP